MKGNFLCRMLSINKHGKARVWDIEKQSTKARVCVVGCDVRLLEVLLGCPDHVLLPFLYVYALFL